MITTEAAIVEAPKKNTGGAGGMPGGGGMGGGMGDMDF
jgi:chaperonin GroEL